MVTNFPRRSYVQYCMRLEIGRDIGREICDFVFFATTANLLVLRRQNLVMILVAEDTIPYFVQLRPAYWSYDVNIL